MLQCFYDRTKWLWVLREERKERDVPEPWQTWGHCRGREAGTRGRSSVVRVEEEEEKRSRKRWRRRRKSRGRRAGRREGNGNRIGPQRNTRHSYCNKSIYLCKSVSGKNWGREGKEIKIQITRERKREDESDKELQIASKHLVLTRLFVGRINQQEAPPRLHLPPLSPSLSQTSPETEEIPRSV